MPRRTEPEILADALKRMPSNQASPDRLAAAVGWEVEKVRRVARRGDEDPTFPLWFGPGGVIKYRGSESDFSNGLYEDIARVITSYWGERDFGLRKISTIFTARAGRRGGGIWTHPDLVIAADPARRNSRDEPRRLHAVEVETAAGFDLRSVYQAHAQGRGADYTWVFGNTTPGVTQPDWERIMWTARELGIGVVTFEKPGAYGTWTTHLNAVHQSPHRAERELFIDTALGEDLRRKHGI